MKRFLRKLIFGVTLMAIGVTMMVFELEGYKVVDAQSDAILQSAYTTQSFHLEKKGVTITVKSPTHISFEWKYDNTMSDEVKVNIPNTIDYSIYQDENKLVLLHTNMNKTEGRWTLFDYASKIIDGLKNKKIYEFSDIPNVVITLSNKDRDRIKIQYDEESR